MSKSKFLVRISGQFWNKAHSLLIVFACIFHLQGFAQVYHVNTITVTDGLISNHINDFAQDSEGLLWISTDKGVIRFDGIHWETTDLPDQLPVAMQARIRIVNDIPVLAGNSKDTKFAIFYYRNLQWNRVPIEDSTGVLVPRYWTVTGNGPSFLFHLIYNDVYYTYFPELNNWSEFPLPKALQNQVSGIEGRGEDLYLYTRKGLFQFKNDDWYSIISNQSEYEKLVGSDAPIRKLIWQDSHIAYLIGDNWLGKFTNGVFERLYLQSGGRNPEFRELVLHPKGFLIFRSNQYYFWYHLESGQLQSFLTDNDDIHAILTKMFIDKRGTLWISSYRGLHFISDFIFLTYSQNEGLIKNEVSLISVLDKNRIFIGGVNSHALLIGGKVSTAYDLKESDQVNVRFMSADTAQGKTYVVGQDLGIGVLNEQSGKLEFVPGINKAFHLIRNVRGTIWIADYMGTIYNLVDNKLIHKNNFWGFVRNIYPLPNDSLLFCTSHGLFKFDKFENKVKIYNERSALQNVYCMLLVNGEYYLGTEDGLAKLNGNKIEKATFQGVEIDNPIYAMLASIQGEYWFGTDNGVFVIKDQKLTHYNELSGLIGSEINRAAFVQGADGRILIGTNRALNIFTHLPIVADKAIFDPQIKWMKVEDRHYQYPWGNLKIKAQDRNISIGFSAISLTQELIYIRYRFNGLDESWTEFEAKTQREISLRNLPAGKYQLELQYRFPSGRWSESLLSTQFSVIAPFYQQWWFFALVFLGVAFVGYFTNQSLTQFKLNQKLKETIKLKIKEIEENEAMLKLALENSRMGVWNYNIKTKTTEYTPEVYKIIGLPEKSSPLNRDNYLLKIHPDDARMVDERLVEAARNGTPYDIEFRVEQLDGAYKWLHGKGKCTYDENGDPLKISGTLSDISRRKSFEAERERLFNELKRANEELDRFVYSVSHDLSAPIKSIKGLISIIRLAKSEAEVSSYVELIERSVDKQEAFIKEIMDYAYNTRSEVVVEPVNLNKLVQDVIDGLMFTNQNNNSGIQNRVPEISVHLDRLRLKIILNNLISNALKFKRSNEEGFHKVWIDGVINEHQFEISVNDNGLGISATDQENIFKMFYRATDKVTGSGLGLYIAKDAAEKMGCQLSVVSKVGEGSRFIIRSKV